MWIRLSEAVIPVVGNHMGVVAVGYNITCFCTSEGICGVASAMDGGGSIQKHVLLFAKRAIKPVQGRTGLILALQKPQMLSQAAKRIPLQSLSVSNLPYICMHSPHTAVTGYRRDYFSLITSHIIAYKGLCFISIFLLLFL